MQIWAHTLVKNEAKWLWYSVSSVIEHVDKILLWDTGSTDDTPKIIKELSKKFPGKIDFRERPVNSPEEFTKVRQEMLDGTKTDWFLIIDGDEIWWEESIRKVITPLRQGFAGQVESIVVPTINLVGDMFHYQEASSGRYKFGDRVGHYNLRAVRRNIPGLHSKGVHGVWGWVDKDGKMIQDRDTFKFIDAPYLHATNLRRSSFDSDVIKRKNKYRFELGEAFPSDFYYPEAFFRDKPDFVESPWRVMSPEFKLRAFFETPARLIKRRLWRGRAGY